jgi:hypothetical protein
MLVLLPTAAVPQGLSTPKDAYLYIISPKDGATITGPFWCLFGLRGMGITHAGDQFPSSGHHHLLIDVDEPLNPNEPISSRQATSPLRFGTNGNAYTTIARPAYTSACPWRCKTFPFQPTFGVEGNYHHDQRTDRSEENG